MLAVDEKTCNRDGICAAVCPMGIIDFSKGQLRRKLPPMPVNCASPAVTAWRCVPRPVSLTRKWRRSNARPFKRTFSCLPSSVSNFFAADDLFGHTRTNRFPREDIARLITVASHSPSGHNAQSPRWRVIDSAVQIKKLAGTVIDWMRWMVGYSRFAYKRLPLRNPPVISWWDER